MTHQAALQSCSPDEALQARIEAANRRVAVEAATEGRRKYGRRGSYMKGLEEVLQVAKLLVEAPPIERPALLAPLRAAIRAAEKLKK